jgi:PGF-CTERM motif protein
VVRRVDAPDTNAWFAALAAIGAFWSVQSVLVGIAYVLLVVGVFHRESGPPRFEPTLLPAAFAGAFVAVRLGGWRGLLGLLAFASIPFIRALTYPIGAAIDCSHGNIDACRGATDLDFVLPQAWLLPGFAMGVLAAVLTRAQVPRRVELEAFGPIALVQFLLGYVLPLIRGYPTPSAFDIVVTVIGLLAAAYILARRSSNPTRSALIVAGVLLLLVVPLIIFELWSNSDPPWEATLWHQWLYFAGPVLLVIATYALSMTSGGFRAPRFARR